MDGFQQYESPFPLSMCLKAALRMSSRDWRYRDRAPMNSIFGELCTWSDEAGDKKAQQYLNPPFVPVKDALDTEQRVSTRTMIRNLICTLLLPTEFYLPDG